MGVVVEIPQYKLMEQSALAWAKKNCPHYITNDGYINNHGINIYRFYFGDSSEAMMFRLKWA